MLITCSRINLFNILWRHFADGAFVAAITKNRGGNGQRWTQTQSDRCLLRGEDGEEGEKLFSSSLLIFPFVLMTLTVNIFNGALITEAKCVRDAFCVCAHVLNTECGWTVRTLVTNFPHDTQQQDPTHHLCLSQWTSVCVCVRNLTPAKHAKWDSGNNKIHGSSSELSSEAMHLLPLPLSLHYISRSRYMTTRTARSWWQTRKANVRWLALCKRRR